MKITFEIPVLPKTPNSIGKASIWASHAERHKWRKIILGEFYEVGPKVPYKKSILTIIRCSSHEPDVDNLYSSNKFVIDGLKYAGFIIDDKPSNILLICKWEKAKRGEGKIIITLESIN
jgi:hypothetical protein